MAATVNLLDPAMLADPFPVYSELRRNSPVCQVEPWGIWAVSRHPDVVTVLKEHKLFTSAGFDAVWAPEWLGDRLPFADSMIIMDPPAHSRLRNLVSRAFTPRSVARLESYVKAVAEELCDRLEHGKEIDFVRTFAEPLPGLVTCTFMGMNPVLHPHFKRWVGDMATVTPVPPSPEHAARIRRSIAEMRSCVAENLAARKMNLGEDIVSDLIRADVDGQKLTDEELNAFQSLLITGGVETTVYLITNAIRLLMDRPAELDRLRADPSLIPTFIGEVLRYESPVRGLFRLAKEDVELSGVKIPAGAFVVALVASANRDEREYPDPDRFDITRGAAPVSFGHGAHYCLGSALARMEGRIALETLFRRFVRFEKASGEIVWPASLTNRGPVNLPVRPIAA
jgi:cytochrome P450